MAYDHSITDGSGRALLSVSIARRLRETVMQLAVRTGVSASDIVEAALEAQLRPPAPTRRTLDAVGTYLHAAEECWALYPRVPDGQGGKAESVYFIQADTTEFVKIGRSLYPQKRLGDLQVSCMFRLKLLQVYMVEEAVSCEKFWHRKLRQYRVSGEWYCLPALLVALLSRLKHH